MPTVDIPAVVHRLHQLVHRGLEFLYAAAHRKVRDNEHFGYYDLARGQETIGRKWVIATAVLASGAYRPHPKPIMLKKIHYQVRMSCDIAEKETNLTWKLNNQNKNLSPNVKNLRW